MLKMTRFTDIDFKLFSKAKKFKDGSKPLIGYINQDNYSRVQWAVVADADGFHMTTTNLHYDHEFEIDFNVMIKLNNDMFDANILPLLGVQNIEGVI